MIELYIPQCSHPQILVSQVALRLIYDGAVLQYFGKELRYGKMINDMPTNYFLKKAYKVFHDCPKNLEQAYVLDADGEVNYLFQLVECGHCSLCLHRKQVDMVNRATLEQQCYDCPPYFITLTYDNVHLPRYGELRYTDVQRFFKRLRRAWDRKNLRHEVRYIVCGEYGHKHGRPHYHILLFNNPYHCDETLPEHYKLWKDIYDAWSDYDPRTGKRVHYCEPQCLKVEPCAGGAPAYVTKYMCKDVRNDKHFFKPFVRASIKHGGIGMPYIRQHLDYFRQNPANGKFVFCDQSDGSVQEITFGKYANRHIFPSVAQLVPVKIREAYRQSVDIITRLVRVGDISFNDGALLVEQLRPSQYIRNKFSRKMVEKVPKLDIFEEDYRGYRVDEDGKVEEVPIYSDFSRRYASRLRSCLSDLVDTLLQPFDLDADIMASALAHRKLAPPQMSNFGSLANRYFTVNMHNTKTLDLSLF